MKKLTGFRYAAFIGVGVSAVLLVMYPIAIQPMMNPEYYSLVNERKTIHINL